MASGMASTLQIGQRVRTCPSADGPARLGTVKYIGEVEGYRGAWIGVDWDDRQGRHNGTLNGVRYFDAAFENSGSFVRPEALDTGITICEALVSRYRPPASVEDEKISEEMYVMSVGQKRVSVQLVGREKIEAKQKQLNELTIVSLANAGVRSPGVPGQIRSFAPEIMELDLTGNLLPDWQVIGQICDELRSLKILHLSNNRLALKPLPVLNLKVLVLNNCCMTWEQVEILKSSLDMLEELHLCQNMIRLIVPVPQDLCVDKAMTVQGFSSLRLLNLEDNWIESWEEIMKLSELRSLEQLNLIGNKIKMVYYPEFPVQNNLVHGNEIIVQPFSKLSCLLLGKNSISNLASVDALDKFPNLTDVRLSENPVSDPARGGVPRYMLVARLSKIVVFNGSEVKPRERKDSEIRYVRHVINTMHNDSEENIKVAHPRFLYLKNFYDISDETAYIGGTTNKNLGASLLSITLKCVASSVGEVAPVTKKLPLSTSLGRLKHVCEGLFKLKATKQHLFVEDKEVPLPLPLEDDLQTLGDLELGPTSCILVDELA